MHLSIGLHTSEGKSYPQPLQPAKHRGITLDINQRLRTDMPNYLSTSREGGRFSPLRKGKYPPAETGKHSPFFMSPSSPLQTATISREIPTIFTPNQQAISQHHTHYLHRSKKRPLLVSKRTSTTHPIVPVLLTRVTSTGFIIGIGIRGQSYIGWRRKLYSFGLIPI